MKTIAVEGWRGINHSFAMANQWQLLEMARRGFNLRHVDVPYYNPQWNRQANSAGLTSDQMRIIDDIPAPIAGEVIDICYRIAFPYNLAPTNAGEVYVFGTSEYQNTQDMFVNRDPKKANKRDRSLFIVTPSRWSKVGFINAGFDDERIKVVPLGVDTSTYFSIGGDGRQIWRKAMGIRDDQFVLLSLGALTENKGVDLLVAAFSILRKKYSHLKLILKDQSNLYGIKGQDVISALKKHDSHHLDDETIADIIYISSNLNTAELRAIYGACDCYVSPYRAEGFNLTPLEAAACGTPVIVTAGGSTDDYFHPLLGSQIDGVLRTNGKYNFIEPDLESLIFQISELIEGRKTVGGLAGSSYVHEHFSWTTVCDQLVATIGLA